MSWEPHSCSPGRGARHRLWPRFRRYVVQGGHGAVDSLGWPALHAMSSPVCCLNSHHSGAVRPTWRPRGYQRCALYSAKLALRCRTPADAPAWRADPALSDQNHAPVGAVLLCAPARERAAARPAQVPLHRGALPGLQAWYLPVGAAPGPSECFCRAAWPSVAHRLIRATRVGEATS